MTSKLALVGLLIGCRAPAWSSGWGNRPIGWLGTIPHCDNPQVVDGTAYRERNGYMVAVGRGQSLVHCADNTIVQIGAMPTARVTIEGPARGGTSSELTYEVHVFARDGSELALQDMVNDELVVWAASVGTMATLPQCSDHGFGMGCGDPRGLRQLKPTGPGVVTITATVGGVTGFLGVTVTPE